MFKNIKKYTIAALCIVASLGSFSSCNFLDVVPPKSMGVDDVMRDKDRAIAYLYSGYEFCTEIYKQHLVRNYVSSVDEYGLPNSWGVNSQRTAWGLPNSGEVWDRNFDYACKYIGRVNHFLYLLDTKGTPQHASPEDVKRWRAECDFLLGFYHMHMLFSIGPCPIMDHWYEDTSMSKYDFPGRSHFDYCVDRICKWFDRAADNLPATVNTDELGRATSVIAKSLKARLLVYAASDFWNGKCPDMYKNWTNNKREYITVDEEKGINYGNKLMNSEYDPAKWDRALTACNEALQAAIDAGRKLYTVADAEVIREAQELDLPVIPGRGDSAEDIEFRKYVSLMQYLFATSDTDGNKETIWGIGDEIKNRYNGSIGYLEWTNTTTPQAITTFNGTIIGGRTGVSPFLYTVEHFYTDKGVLPDDDPDFQSDDAWKFARRDDIVVKYKVPLSEDAEVDAEPTYTERRPIINLNCNREPRFYAWISFDGAEYAKVISNGEPLYIDMIDPNKQGYNTKYGMDINITGYLCRKFVQPNYIVSSSRSMDDNLKQQSVRAIPFAVIRLAELYLNIAECNAMKQDIDIDAAVTNLNIIRERAGVPALNSSDISTREELMEWIRNERFVELWGEGHRYFDLRRWCMAPDYLKAGVREGLDYRLNATIESLNKRVTVNQNFVWEDRMYLQPIVYNEVDSNPQLVQSPGY